ncbi:major facilitator superfamily domain-containing protein [Rhypophila decipiens]|uniref:Major facilitator superfamily domain-containing protein n=1 Tax=Rhypophila decipiens TaxID=261697 RepID=A0AAN7B1G0_9PEZI|nr:major facilitator superfamily domain-containing protein [Rhypophila decipiens]
MAVQVPDHTAAKRAADETSDKSSSSIVGQIAAPATREDGVEKAADFERGFRFWTIIIGLGITTLLASLEHTVVTTAAPYILQELDLKENFVWITNAFFICSTALTPLFGQLCDIFGRRWVFLTIIAIFTLGRGICGGASTGNMLIAGRAIQGAGSGGIVLTVNIIVSDLCPLRKRGQYMAVILAVFGLGVAIGPFIGGAIAERTTWRWVFYINLPIGGLSMIIMFFFLRVKRAILGFFALGLFVAFEASGWASEPVMPTRLFKHRTSIVVLCNTFLNTTIYFWYLYFLPVYFQAVALYIPSRAGYSLLPQALAGAPGAMLAAIALSRWGKFKPIHFVGFGLTALGMGLLSLLDQDRSTGEWAVFQIICALGIGIIIDTLLPAFQAPVAEKDQALATSTWGFVRAFGCIWGVAIPAVIFKNFIDGRVGDMVSNAKARELLGAGGAYQSASAAFVLQFEPLDQEEIRALTSASRQDPGVLQLPTSQMPVPTSQTAIIQSPSVTGHGTTQAVISHTVPIPTLDSPDDILIKVSHVALNPCDYKIPSAFPTPGAIIGNDFVGTVVAIHHSSQSAVRKRFPLGTTVCGLIHGSNPGDPSNGAFATYIRASASLVLRVPESWKPSDAATLGSGLTTAFVVLFAQGPGAGLSLPISPDNPGATPPPLDVLVYGASTSVGTMALQLLKLSGAGVIAVCSPHNFGLVKGYGADFVFDYADPETPSRIRQVTNGELEYGLDVIADTESVGTCQAAISRYGGILTVLEKYDWAQEQSSLRRKTVDVRFPLALEIFGKELKLSNGYERPSSEERRKEARKWFEVYQRLLDEGKLRPHPVKVLESGWQSILDGLGVLKSGSVSGYKIVVPLVELSR